MSPDSKEDLQVHIHTTGDNAIGQGLMLQEKNIDTVCKTEHIDTICRMIFCKKRV